MKVFYHLAGREPILCDAKPSDGEDCVDIFRDGQLVVGNCPLATAPGDGVATEVSAAKGNLKEASLAELKLRADKLGVDYPAKVKKGDLVALIEAAEAEDAEAEGDGGAG